MRSQNAGLGLKGSSYGASSSDSYRDKLKKLVCLILLNNYLAIFYVTSENSTVSLGDFDIVAILMIH